MALPSFLLTPLARYRHRAMVAFWSAWDGWVTHPERESRLKTGRNRMLMAAVAFLALGTLWLLWFASVTQPNPQLPLKDWAPGYRLLVLGATGLVLFVAWQLFNRGLEAWIPRARAERWNDPKLVQAEKDMRQAGLHLPLLLTPVEWFLAPRRPGEAQKRLRVCRTLEATLPCVPQAPSPRPRL